MRWPAPRGPLAFVAVSALLAIAAGCGGSVDDDAKGSGGSGASSGSAGAGGGSAGTGGTNSCDGKQCGDACSPCTAGSPSCKQGTCDNSGECTDALGLCVGTECKQPSDCPAPPPVCDECPDGTFFCPGVDCENGFCVTAPPDCGPSPGYDPCAGAFCGHECQLCNPIISSCSEPAGDRRCTIAPNDALRCTLGPFPCPK